MKIGAGAVALVLLTAPALARGDKKKGYPHEGQRWETAEADQELMDKVVNIIRQTKKIDEMKGLGLKMKAEKEPKEEDGGGGAIPPRPHTSIPPPTSMPTSNPTSMPTFNPPVSSPPVSSPPVSESVTMDKNEGGTKGNEQNSTLGDESVAKEKKKDDKNKDGKKGNEQNSTLGDESVTKEKKKDDKKGDDSISNEQNFTIPVSSPPVSEPVTMDKNKDGKKGDGDDKKGKENKDNQKDKKNKEEDHDEDHDHAALLSEVGEYKLVHDKTMREGFGDSPGLIALEYLGMGYDIARGNPRGSDETGEQDPGWRRPVIHLIQDQNKTSFDFEKLEPFGTSIRYRTGCKFSSKAKELSTSSDYQDQLTSEANVGGSYGFFSAKLSKKYEKFTQDQVNTQRTSFESKAACTEWEATLLSYYEHKAQEAFQVAAATLPREAFDPNNATQLFLYDAFINEYGTHYSNNVVLGAKHIVRKSFSSRSVMQLTKTKIDISAALGFGSDVTDDSSGSSDASKGVCCNNSVSFGPTEPEPPFSLSGGYTYSRTKTSKDTVEGSVEDVDETNIGGTPPESENWKEWAASVPERLMPVQYNLLPISDFVDQDLKENLDLAIFDHYERAGIPFNRPYTTGVVKEAMRFGAYQKDGNPISTYTLTPQEDLRTLAVLHEVMSDNDSDGVPDDPDSLPSFISYDFVWESQDEAVSAPFLTFIRDNICPNIEEDLNEFAFLEQFSDKAQINTKIFPYGVMQTLSEREVKIAVGSFKPIEDKTLDELNDFCFLAVDNIEADHKFISGVVHPQGYPLNKRFGKSIGYKVEQYDDRHFQIIFDKEFHEEPTFLTFPIWAPLPFYEPNNPGQIMIAPTGCTKKYCNVTTGAIQEVYTQWTKSNGFIGDLFSSPSKSVEQEVVDDEVAEALGFSFFAVDGALKENPGLIHGVVDLTKPDQPKITVRNSKNETYFTAEARFTTGDTKLTSFNSTADNVTVDYELGDQLIGGVQIRFGTPFLCIPSVIVTPIIEDSVRNYTGTKIDNTPGLRDFKHTRYSEKYSRSGWGIAELVFTAAATVLFAPVAPILALGFAGAFAGNIISPILWDPNEVTGFRGPFGVVEHLTEDRVFIKAGLLDTYFLIDDDDPDESIYRPTKFHFVAVGPVELDAEEAPSL